MYQKQTHTATECAEVTPKATCVLNKPEVDALITDVIARSHPAANLFPMPTEDKLRDLANDMKANGQLCPVITLGDRILDGRSREVARQLAGLDAYHIDFADVSTTASPSAYVMSVNMRRRDLDVTDRAKIAAALLPMMEAEAKERRGARTDRNPDDNRKFGRATEMAGKAAGVSADSVRKATLVGTHGCEELKNALNGKELSLNVAAKIARQPRNLQQRMIAEARAKPKRSATPKKRPSEPAHTPAVTPPTANAIVHEPQSFTAIASALLTLSAAAREYDTASKRQELVKAMKAETNVGTLAERWTAVFDFSEVMIPACRQCSTK
jgi:hypothetical protein